MMETKVGIVMGSDSDYNVLKKACEVLKAFDVGYEVLVASAHRTPEVALEYASSAEKRGLKVIRAGAGAAAHLAGVLAAKTILPIIGVPINATALNGLDALYAIVQMPSGVPVATVALDGAKNAGLLAIQMLALNDADLSKKLHDYRLDMAAEVALKNEKVQALVKEIN